jgi:hypothetical protein
VTIEQELREWTRQESICQCVELTQRAAKHVAELEAANREYALNEAKMRTGWWIQNYQELHAKVAARDAVLRKIVETAQEHPAKANFVAVHRQIIGEANQFLTQAETVTKP